MMVFFSSYHPCTVSTPQIPTFHVITSQSLRSGMRVTVLPVHHDASYHASQGTETC